MFDVQRKANRGDILKCRLEVEAYIENDNNIKQHYL